MKFKAKSNALQKGISIVEKAVSNRTSLPILENIFLELKEGQLKLRGNDLEIGIENSFPIEGEIVEGSVLVKAKTFSNIISKLPQEELDISVDENNKVIIKGSKVDFDIHGTDTKEYPVFPTIDGGSTFQLKVGELCDLIKHTIFSVSFDETKQFLNGILVENKEGHINFVATDGYRLALKKQQFSLSDPFSVIAPYKAINELNKIIQSLDPEKEVEVTVSKTQIAFKMKDFLLVSRVIQGQFPDYGQVIPSETNIVFSVPRKALLDACERASIIASASNNVVRLKFEENSLTLEANAKELGDFKESCDISRIMGDGSLEIAFNVRLLLDVIKTLTTDDIKMSFNNELSPGKVQSISDDSFTYIIMPIRTNTYQQADKKEQAEASPEPVNG
jgi:DNA polymerase III subunit beta